MISEFQLIDRFFTRQRVRRDDVLLGVGDDAALLRVPEGQALAVSVDTLVEGVHFLSDMPPRDLGYRALAVNLSDLAAMGAQPAWATLALTLPCAEVDWLGEFSAGFFELAHEFDVQLVGGNTARGPLSVTVQVHGFVPPAHALTRRGARAGDLVFVTGTLGDAALGLRIERGELQAADDDAATLRGRFRHPTPRVAAGVALRGLASACIDVSDGLLADLGHILDASGVGARVWVDDLPLSTAYVHARGDATDWNAALNGGDDYELCFTANPAHRERIERAVAASGCAAACIGAIESTPGLRCEYRDGRPYRIEQRGYQHFGPET
jgi:thiamine-monophosphate kinase